MCHTIPTAKDLVPIGEKTQVRAQYIQEAPALDEVCEAAHRMGHTQYDPDTLRDRVLDKSFVWEWYLTGAFIHEYLTTAL